MANNNNPPRPQGTPQVQISEGTVLQMIKIEEQKMILNIQKQQSRDKEIDAQLKIAEISIKAQTEHLKAKPGELRKTIGLVATIIIIILALFCVFIGYLLNTNNKDFAYKIFLGLSHISTLLIGVFVGNRGKKTSNHSIPPDIQEPEVTDN